MKEWAVLVHWTSGKWGSPVQACKSVAQCWKVLTLLIYTYRIRPHLWILLMKMETCNRLVFVYSLQFDPAPRRGEPHVTRRTPDYFLWGEGVIAVNVRPQDKIAMANPIHHLHVRRYLLTKDTIRILSVCYCIPTIIINRSI